MFNKYFVMLLVSVYALAPCVSVCDQYILLLKHFTQSDILKPMKLNDIDWSSADCPINSSNTLSCSEIYANRSCIIEIEYESSYRSCVEDIKPTNYSKDEYETMTPREYYTTKYYPEWTNTTENPQINDPLKCEIRDKQCGDNHKEINDINIIYVSENTTQIRNKFDNINNRLKNLDHVLRCSYSDICSNHNDFANTANTKLAFISQTTNTEETELLNFNCSYLNDKNNIHEQYIKITYNILKKHNCEANSAKLNNDTSYVNVYFQKDYIHNDSADINCVNNFKSINNETLSIKCNQKLNNNPNEDFEVDRTVVTIEEKGSNNKNDTKNTRLLQIIQEPLENTSNEHKAPYNKKTKDDNILMYIIAGMLTIAALSIITIFVLKAYKPIYHLTSTREWPQMENSAL